MVSLLCCGRVGAHKKLFEDDKLGEYTVMRIRKIEGFDRHSSYAKRPANVCWNSGHE
jgi:hypothetical protein